MKFQLQKILYVSLKSSYLILKSKLELKRGLYLFLTDRLLGVFSYGVPILLVVLIGFYFYKKRKQH